MNEALDVSALASALGHARPAFTADLGGRVALVTGASGSLGARFALTLAANGAAVALAGRRTDRLAALQRQIDQAGGRALAVAMDVTSDESVAQALDKAQSALGPVDIVVNNSGVAGDTAAALETGGASFDEVFAVNVGGARRVAVVAANRLVAAGRPGTIVNIASVLSFRVAGGVSAYAASKAALVQLTRALALEWARHGVRVNAIAPGYIETELNTEFLASEAGQALRKRVPQRRFGRADELDGALLLLASDASSFMTGETIVVDGGHLHSSL